jgi:hypothetical protein
MVTVFEFWRRGVLLACIAFLWCVADVGVRAADAVRSPDEAFLDALQGTWTMAGTLRGKPVRYVADGQRALQGGFVKLHMVDSESRTPYEADVYIGFDAKANDYIAHWLDRFGAPGARVVAKGERHGPQLVLIFPYAEGAFRDTFTWQPATGTWSLLVESKETDGSWSIFAKYSLTHRAPH